MKIELEGEQIDKVVATEMRYLIDVFEEYLEDNLGTIFYTDPEEDAREINRHIEAFHTVLEYHSVGDE